MSANKNLRVKGSKKQHNMSNYEVVVIRHRKNLLLSNRNSAAARVCMKSDFFCLLETSFKKYTVKLARAKLPAKAAGKLIRR